LSAGAASVAERGTEVLLQPKSGYVVRFVFLGSPGSHLGAVGAWKHGTVEDADEWHAGFAG
jgi:hypothetical protein